MSYLPAPPVLPTGAEPSSRSVAFAAGPLAGLTIRCMLEPLPAPNSALVVPRAHHHRRTQRSRAHPAVRCRIFAVESTEGGIEEEEVVDCSAPAFAVGFVCLAQLLRTGPSDAVNQDEDAGLGQDHGGAHVLGTPEPSSHYQDATAQLTGSKVASATWCAAAAADDDDAPHMLFSFPDLAVAGAGTFRLRFRLFNVLAIARAPPMRPLLAQCTGGPFCVGAAVSPTRPAVTGERTEWPTSEGLTTDVPEPG